MSSRAKLIQKRVPFCVENSTYRSLRVAQLHIQILQSDKNVPIVKTDFDGIGIRIRNIGFRDHKFNAYLYVAS